MFAITRPVGDVVEYYTVRENCHQFTAHADRACLFTKYDDAKSMATLLYPAPKVVLEILNVAAKKTVESPQVAEAKPAPVEKYSYSSKSKKGK